MTNEDDERKIALARAFLSGEGTKEFRDRRNLGPASPAPVPLPIDFGRFSFDEETQLQVWMREEQPSVSYEIPVSSRALQLLGPVISADLVSWVLKKLVLMSGGTVFWYDGVADEQLEILFLANELSQASYFEPISPLFKALPHFESFKFFDRQRGGKGFHIGAKLALLEQPPLSFRLNYSRYGDYLEKELLHAFLDAAEHAKIPQESRLEFVQAANAVARYWRGEELSNELLVSIFGQSAYQEVLDGQNAGIKNDPVAVEIAREITIRWVDRKNEPHKGQPWTKNPKVFIEHVYSKWLQAGTLRRAHLSPDERLYQAYKQHVLRHPEDDLNLPTEKRTPVTDPLATIESRRAINAEKARLRRAAKKVPS